MDDVNKIIEESKPKPYGIIYYVLNTRNGKCYVGQTTRSWEIRWRQHIYDSRPGRSKRYFSKAIHHYGPRYFEVRVIFTAYSKEDLDSAEIYYIEFFDSTNTEIGYNSTLGGSPEIPNEATRKKMAKAKLGVPRPAFTPEHRANMGKVRKGKTLSLEQRKVLSIAHQGQIPSPETTLNRLISLEKAILRREEEFNRTGKGIPGPTVVAEDYLSGLSTVDISKKYNISTSTVKYKLRKSNTSIRSSSESRNITEKRRLDEESDFIKSLVEDYLSGTSLRDLSVKYGLSRTAVKSRVEKSGIKIRTKKESWSNQYVR